MDAAPAAVLVMRPAAEGRREAGCRLTSRQTTVAANIAEREVLMACCQGDTGQPGSVSFADANETLQLLPTLAKPPLETQTAPPTPSPQPPLPLPGEQPLHTPELREESGCATIYLLFTFACDAPPLCPVCLCSSGKEGLLIVSKCPTTPTLTSSLLVSSPLPLIPCVELAFSERGGW